MNSHFVYCTTIDNVFGEMDVRYHRALTKCIMDVKEFKNKLLDKSKYTDISLYKEKLDVWIDEIVDEEGLYVVREVPFISIGRTGRYIINARYTIAKECL